MVFLPRVYNFKRFILRHFSILKLMLLELMLRLDPLELFHLIYFEWILILHKLFEETINFFASFISLFNSILVFRLRIGINGFLWRSNDGFVVQGTWYHFRILGLDLLFHWICYDLRHRDTWLFLIRSLRT